VKLNIPNPDTTSAGTPTILYDANGNRTSFAPYGTTDTYTTNNLNQYTQRNATNATYDLNGNLTIGVDGSTYVYDQQNRLTQASKSGTTDALKYDGFNRQVSRTVTGQSGTTYSVWDGWDLIEEYQSGNNVTGQYLYGPGGLIKNLTTNNYYYQDASGSTSHLTDSNGQLLEWYRYDLRGTPTFYDANNNQLSASNYSVRHLFTGQQWYSELGLYDLRNRFYSPDIGRFLQPDPIDFNGDPTNLYRYCGNNPVTRSDPDGETVYLSQHSVALIGNHAYLTIIPSDPANFAGSGFLQGGALTISGEPVGGYLNMQLNSDTPGFTSVIQPPPGVTDVEFDNAVWNSATSYPNDTYAYFFLPELGAWLVPVYNSNGFVVYVLIGASVPNAQELLEGLPGWQPGSGYPPPAPPVSFTTRGQPLLSDRGLSARQLGNQSGLTGVPLTGSAAEGPDAIYGGTFSLGGGIGIGSYAGSFGVFGGGGGNIGWGPLEL